MLAMRPNVFYKKGGVHDRGKLTQLWDTKTRDDEWVSRRLCYVTTRWPFSQLWACEARGDHEPNTGLFFWWLWFARWESVVRW